MIPRGVFKAGLLLICLVPLGLLVLGLFTGSLGPNPVEALNRGLGDWALRFLLVTLCLRPAASITGRKSLIAYRRMLGLFAFFYAALHMSNYVIIDLQLDLAAFTEGSNRFDVGRGQARPFGNELVAPFWKRAQGVSALVWWKGLAECGVVRIGAESKELDRVLEMVVLGQIDFQADGALQRHLQRQIAAGPYIAKGDLGVSRCEC